MPSSKLLAEHTPSGDVCAICGGKCHGTPSLDGPRDRPMVGSSSATWRAWNESRVPQDNYIVTTERIFVDGVLLYGENVRVPLDIARQLGLDILAKTDTSGGDDAHDQPDPRQIADALAAREAPLPDREQPDQ